MVGSLTFESRFTSFGFFCSRYFSGPISFVSPGAFPGQSFTTVGSAARVESASANVIASTEHRRFMLPPG